MQIGEKEAIRHKERLITKALAVDVNAIGDYQNGGCQEEICPRVPG